MIWFYHHFAALRDLSLKTRILETMTEGGVKG